MSKKSDSTALAIVEAFRADGDAKTLPFNVLLNMASAFAHEVRTHALTEKVLNTAPSVPGDNPPGAKKYPSRTEIAPEYEPVPDPAETETSEPSKKSLPDYAEYQTHVGTLQNSGLTLFELESGDDEKMDAIRDAVGALDGIRSQLKQF